MELFRENESRVSCNCIENIQGLVIVFINIFMFVILMYVLCRFCYGIFFLDIEGNIFYDYMVFIYYL